MTYDTISDAVTRAGGAGALLAGRYSIVRLLGNGGMGNVWLAEDTQLDNKLFAIKMLPSIMVNNKRAYAQLKAEALKSMKLTHTNIVTTRVFEENDGNPFLVMDYIDGQTLDDYLAEHTGTTGVSPVGHGDTGTTGVSPVGYGSTGTTGVSPVWYGSTGTTGILPVDVLRILRPIAAALDYAHAKGVVHRDVKPGNVMIAKDGTPYILDFGIARETQETMTRVTGKLSSGTLLYMSAEQLTGESPKPAQDIYSFAAMAYECLKGEPPFSRGNIEWQILNKQPDPLPTEGLTGNAAILAAGVMAGLAKKPEDRPATCTAVLEGKDFSRVEHVERVDGGGDDLGHKEHKERKGGLGKGFAVVALLAALAGGAWWFVNAPAARSTGTTGVSPVASNGVTGTTGVSPVASNGTTGTTGILPVATNNTSALAPKPIPPKPIPPKPIPSKTDLTDADVKKIAIDAGTQEKLIKDRLDDSQGYFKERKDELDRILARARTNREEQNWAEAAQGFTNYVNGCQKLLNLDNERQSANESKAKAEEAKNHASEAGATQYAEQRWNEASALLKEANDKFGARSFADADRKYAAAAKQFALCVDEAKAERKRREDARDGAISIKTEIVRDIEPELKRFKAEDCAQATLADGNKLREEGNNALSRGDFPEAENKLKQAKEKLAVAVKEARDYRVDSPLRRAREHSDASRWQQCIDECDMVLGWDSANAEAKRIKAEAEGHLVPSLTIVAKIGESIVDGAKVRIDGKDYNTPVERKKLTEGARMGPYSVSYESGGKRYYGTFDAVTVDWPGPREIPVALKESTGPNVGRVQLWDRGPYWATMNIGAKNPEDCGYYFWWGDTVGYKRVNDAWVARDGSQSNFSFAPGNAPTRGKSNDELRNEEWITEDGVLAPEHDAAHVQWGEGWRMPTLQELTDLSNKCDWKWTTVNDVNGYAIHGRGKYASASIFLPAAGYGIGTSLSYSGSYGYYWSSVPYSDRNYASDLYFGSGGHGTYDYASHLYFGSGGHGTYDYNYRDGGFSVRPVQGVAK